MICIGHRISLEEKIQFNTQMLHKVILLFLILMHYIIFYLIVFISVKIF